MSNHGRIWADLEPTRGQRGWAADEPAQPLRYLDDARDRAASFSWALPGVAV